MAPPRFAPLVLGLPGRGSSEILGGGRVRVGGRPLREFAVVTSQVLQLPDTSAFPSDELKRLRRLEPAAANTHG